MALDDAEIVEYLKHLGYEYNKCAGSEVIGGTAILSKGYISIHLDTFFNTTLKIYKGTVEVFDINKKKRRVINSGSGGKIKSRGIPSPITLDELKSALRDLKLSELLNDER